MEIMPEIDVTPFLQIIDMAFRAAWYTLMGILVGSIVATIVLIVFGGDQE